jgi:hypothetical protein
MGISAIRRVAIVGAVVGFACLPRVAHGAAQFDSVLTDCSVDRVTLLTTAGPCPRYAKNLTGDASAVGTLDASTGSFFVGSDVVPHAGVPLVIGQRHATAIVMGTRTATSALGGPVKVVFDHLSGATAGGCLGCAPMALGQAYGSTAVGVSLYFHSPAGTVPQGTLCLLYPYEGAVPEHFVYPDDCPQPDVTLSVPPNSTFDITVTAIATADAVGAASGHAYLAGHVAEIQIP